MNIKQVFTYLEENLLPEKGGKVQFVTGDKQEIMRIFIFDEVFFNYKYIFSFIKNTPEVGDKPTFQTFIKSGFSGVEHELVIPLTEEMYQGIKDGLYHLDALFMNKLKEEILTYPAKDEPKAKEDGVE